MGRPVAPPEERFWRRCVRGGPQSCWLWQGYILPDGYGRFRLGPPWGPATVRAHRWLFEQLVGPIPEGLVLDHLCRVRHCVNPAHMEVVTLAENSRRAGLSNRRTGQLQLPLEWA